LKIQEVRVGIQPLGRFGSLIPEARMAEALRAGHALQQRLATRVVWNVNSTAVGGGVAEMLQSLLGYTRSVGIDTRWVVISGSPEFFRITKRIHHALHGSPGDGSVLDPAARAVYETALRENAAELALRIRPGDIVILHDPQTAGLAPALAAAGAQLIWRCHIGLDVPNTEADAGWRFLQPYLESIPHYVFSRESYIPESCDHGKSVVIRPSIDAFSPKNQELDENAIRTILVHTGLVAGPSPHEEDPCFQRDDGTPGRVERRPSILRAGLPPDWDTPLIVQVSRWDPLKDMLGVMQGFALLCDRDCALRPELVLAGPDVSGVTDDPEGAVVFAAVAEAWRALAPAIRNRVHLVSLPTADIQENAAIVNALQRHATVVVQKSLQEGFGLTVTEAMWKARPVLASAVGGIQDQIEDGVSGVLLDDATDLDAFADTLCSLLEEPDRMQRLGAAARKRVRDHFLGVDHLLKYAVLLSRMT